MPVKCQTIINFMEEYAPRKLAEDWDNVGLQIGDPSREIHKVMVTLDVNEEVAIEAIEMGADLIISHHPLIFKPMKNIRFDLPLGKVVSQLIERGVMLFSAHTNLDSAERGVNATLANLLELVKTEPLSVSFTEELVKLVVFGPATHADIIREAIADTGAGFIGKYSHSAFMCSGTGTFKPLAGTKPYQGHVGLLERVEEVRIETIMPRSIASRVVKAMLKVHPYEEVAYDLYPLINQGKTFGLGRIGYLPEPLTLKDFINRVKTILNIDYVRAGGNPEAIVKKVALCGGSGASLIHRASFAGADVLLTGDLKYHEAQDALTLGMSFIDAGHHATEKIIVPALAEYLKLKTKSDKIDIEILLSGVDSNPFMWYR